MRKLSNDEYQTFIKEVKDKIYAAQYEAFKVVNTYLISLYWGIGKMIVERQERLGWGKSVVEKLSKELQLEFPDLSGFSTQNLWYMRLFYSEYMDNSILQPLVGEISWSKHIIILSKCKNDLERVFYIKMTKKNGWTKAVLIHQIENKSYEKFLISQSNFDETIPEKYKHQAKLALKDEYTFDFLELATEHSEHELELALMKNIRCFLIEMGGDYTFVGNQFPIQVGKRNFKIDILLFHRRLKSLVAIDLKITDFEPEYKGKIEFYLTALNENIKLPDENDAIGIIICKNKDEMVVEYALKSSHHPIGVASYQISADLPKDLEGLLPNEYEIKQRLENSGLLQVLEERKVSYGI